MQTRARNIQDGSNMPKSQDLDCSCGYIHDSGQRWYPLFLCVKTYHEKDIIDEVIRLRARVCTPSCFGRIEKAIKKSSDLKR